MVTQDRISQLLNDFPDFVERIAGILHAGDAAQAERLLEEQSEKLFSLDTRLLETMPYDALLYLIGENDPLLHEKTDVMGQMLLLQGEVLEKRKETNRAAGLRNKAFELMLWQYASDSSQKDLLPVLLHRAGSVSASTMEKSSVERLYAFFLREHQYRNSCELLEQMVRRAGSKSEKKKIADLGFSFYVTLMRMDEEKMKKGQLTREEADHYFGSFLKQVGSVRVSEALWSEMLKSEVSFDAANLD